MREMQLSDFQAEFNIEWDKRFKDQFPENTDVEMDDMLIPIKDYSFMIWMAGRAADRAYVNTRLVEEAKRHGH